jgi:hypothetical protein
MQSRFALSRWRYRLQFATISESWRKPAPGSRGLARHRAGPRMVANYVAVHHQSRTRIDTMDISTILQNVSFGERIAEEDNELEAYFVETNQWRRIVKGEIDIIYGPKGAGKSAFYFLLLKKRDELSRLGNVLIAGENFRGATAFQDLATDPPASELEFTGIWKLYIASIVGLKIKELGLSGRNATSLISILADAGLLKSGGLEGTLRAVRKCVRALLKRAAVESEVALDPATGSVTGVTSRITLRDSDDPNAPLVSVSLDALLTKANDALDTTVRLFEISSLPET